VRTVPLTRMHTSAELDAIERRINNGRRPTQQPIPPPRQYDQIWMEL